MLISLAFIVSILIHFEKEDGENENMINKLNFSFTAASGIGNKYIKNNTNSYLEKINKENLKTVK